MLREQPVGARGDVEGAPSCTPTAPRWSGRGTSAAWSSRRGPSGPSERPGLEAASAGRDGHRLVADVGDRDRPAASRARLAGQRQLVGRGDDVGDRRPGSRPGAPGRSTRPRPRRARRAGRRPARTAGRPRSCAVLVMICLTTAGVGEAPPWRRAVGLDHQRGDAGGQRRRLAGAAEGLDRSLRPPLKFVQPVKSGSPRRPPSRPHPVRPGRWCGRAG